MLFNQRLCNVFDRFLFSKAIYCMYVQVKFYTNFENDALNKHLTSVQFQFISQTKILTYYTAYTK